MGARLDRPPLRQDGPALSRRTGQRRSLGPRWRRDADGPAAAGRCRDDGRRVGRLPQREPATTRRRRGRGQEDPEALRRDYRSTPGRIPSSACWVGSRPQTSSISQCTAGTTRSVPATGSTSSRARPSIRSRSAARTSRAGHRSSSSTHARSAAGRSSSAATAGSPRRSFRSVRPPSWRRCGRSTTRSPSTSRSSSIARRSLRRTQGGGQGRRPCRRGGHPRGDRRRARRRRWAGRDDRPTRCRGPPSSGTRRARPERGRPIVDVSRLPVLRPSVASAVVARGARQGRTPRWLTSTQVDRRSGSASSGFGRRGSPGPPTLSTRCRAPGSVPPAGQAASSRQLWTGLRWRRPTSSRSRQPSYRARRRPSRSRHREPGRRRTRCPAATGRLRAGGPVGRRGRRHDVVVRTVAGSRPPPDTRRDRNTDLHRPPHDRRSSEAGRASGPIDLR